MNCERCSAEFAVDAQLSKARQAARRYCSLACALLARWGQILGSRPCEACGVTMVSPRSRRRRFCSFACRCQAQRGVARQERQRRVQVNCTECGCVIERRPCEVRGQPFCSPTCQASWQTKHVRGPAHPLWAGGAPRGSYLGGWATARKKALHRAGGMCERCHAQPAVDVHHKTPVRLCTIMREAHAQSNLLAVCEPCHAAIHAEARAIMHDQGLPNSGPSDAAGSG